MTLPRDEVVTGLRAQMEQFEDLVRSLDDAGWQAPTRCEVWTVADELEQARVIADQILVNVYRPR
jgi:hypothetical protein